MNGKKRSARQLFVSMRLRNSSIASTITRYIEGLKRDNKWPAEPSLEKLRERKSPISPKLQPKSCRTETLVPRRQERRLQTSSCESSIFSSRKISASPLQPLQLKKSIVSLSVSQEKKASKGQKLTKKRTPINASISQNKDNPVLESCQSNIFRVTGQPLSHHIYREPDAYNFSKFRSLSSRESQKLSQISQIPKNSQNSQIPKSEKLQARVSSKLERLSQRPEKYSTKVIYTEEAMNFIEDYFNRPSYTLLKLKQRRLKLI